jgi:hypothetical protein
MMQASPIFRKPNSFERTLNKAFGILVGLGIGLRHNYLLQVPGPQDGARLFDSDRSAGGQRKALSGRSARALGLGM